MQVFTGALACFQVQLREPRARRLRRALRSARRTPRPHCLLLHIRIGSRILSDFDCGDSDSDFDDEAYAACACERRRLCLRRRVLRRRGAMCARQRALHSRAVLQADVALLGARVLLAARRTRAAPRVPLVRRRVLQLQLLRQPCFCLSNIDSIGLQCLRDVEYSHLSFSLRVAYYCWRCSGRPLWAHSLSSGRRFCSMAPRSIKSSSACSHSIEDFTRHAHTSIYTTIHSYKFLYGF